jgi:hypothetical protein
VTAPVEVEAPAETADTKAEALEAPPEVVEETLADDPPAVEPVAVEEAKLAPEPEPVVEKQAATVTTSKQTKRKG